MARFNDVFQQRMDSLALSDEEKLKREEEMTNCHHLYVKLDEIVERLPEYMSMSIVQCVHCGLTNKFKNVDDGNLRRRRYFGYNPSERTVETKVFDKTYQNCYRKSTGVVFPYYHFYDDELEFLEREDLNTNHPKLLFDLAREINLSLDYRVEEDRKEIFRIMKELNAMETDEERIYLKSVYDASDLIERYRTKHNTSSIIR